MKLRDIAEARKGPKEIVLRSKLRSKKNDTPKEDGAVSFHVHAQKGLSGDMINPTAGSVGFYQT